MGTRKFATIVETVLMLCMCAALLAAIVGWFFVR